jgi:DNA primase
MSQAFAIGFAADSFDAIARAAKAGGITESLLAAAGLIRPGQRGGFYDTFRNRLLFPIVDTTGRVIGFGGRALGDDPAKYLNTPENILFEKGRNVFGLNRAKDAMARTGRGIVVEGYMDCLMAHQHGFDETIATLGTAFTTEQAQLLRRFTDTVILVFDSDEAGAKAADRALSVSLLQNLDVRLARVPTGKDPCDYLLAAGRDAFSELLINAVSAIEFRWRQVVVRCQDDESAPARRRALDEFLEQVAGWVNAGAVDVIQRGLVLNQVAKLLALSPSEVHSRVVALERQARRSPSRDAAPAPQEAVRLAPSTDGVAKAARELIEVLVCEPSLWEQCEPVLAGRSVSDPVLARLVSEVFAWCRAPAGDGGPQVADLIGRLGSPEYGRIITDLQRAGQARGNYAATVQGALFCIEEADRGRQTAEAGRLVRSDQDRESQDRALLAVHEAGRARRHFAPLSAKKTGH